MKFPGFVGPSYTLDSKNANCQRTVNWYPEMDETGLGKEGEPARLRGTPGLTKILEVGDGPIRCIHVESRADGQKILAISADKAYLIEKTAGVWGSTLLSTGGPSTLDTTEGIVVAASTEHFTVFVDGDMNSVFVDETDPTPDYFSRFDSLGYPGVPLATHIAYLDGYLIYNKAGTNQFFCSDLSNALSVSPLDFASAEADPDNIVALIANARDLWLFGERTTEIWINTGNADFPFERVSGGFFEVGCLAPYSVAKTGGVNSSVIWLGKDEHGQGQVYIARGPAPQRISTFAVETAIQTYEDPSAATAWVYQNGGHTFYVLNFAENTWVYDLATGMWHERAYFTAGAFERHRAEVHAFVPDENVHLVGDYDSNKIYILDESVYTDDTAAIKRMRRTPHVSSGLKRVFCQSLELNMETGVGLDGASSVQGTDPQIMLRWSDDGGNTWSNEKWRSIGKIGEYKKRVRWERLGAFRDRVWEISITDPVKAEILGAEIELQTGAS